MKQGVADDLRISKASDQQNYEVVTLHAPSAI